MVYLSTEIDSYYVIDRNVSSVGNAGESFPEPKERYGEMRGALYLVYSSAETSLCSTGHPVVFRASAPQRRFTRTAEQEQSKHLVC